MSPDLLKILIPSLSNFDASRGLYCRNSSTSPLVLKGLEPVTINIFEYKALRTYKVFPGKMKEWIKFMENEIIPFQVSKGMVIHGSFTVENDDETYVWIRRFENESQRELLYSKV